MTENGLLVLGGPEPQLHDLLWVGLDPPVGHEEAQKLARRNTKHTLLTTKKDTSVTFWAEQFFSVILMTLL